MSIAKLIKIATDEIGYLEKKSAKDLDSKTKNAGRGNYTKYWRDLKPAYQGQPWCQAFVNWCFYRAYGLSTARKLLCVSSFDYYTPTCADAFKEAGQWYSAPKVGDVVYFKNSTRIHHVGLVVAVTTDAITTIEGNTSPQASDESVVANGGGVWSRVYSKQNGAIAGYGRPAYSSLCLNFVNRLYRQALGRSGEEAGIAYWASGLSKGTETGVSAAKGFYLGKEYTERHRNDRAFLTDLYKGLLGRSPDESGYRFWLGRLESGRLTRSDVVKGFAESAEYYNECYKYGIDRGTW